MFSQPGERLRGNRNMGQLAWEVLRGFAVSETVFERVCPGTSERTLCIREPAPSQSPSQRPSQSASFPQSCCPLKLLQPNFPPASLPLMFLSLDECVQLPAHVHLDSMLVERVPPSQAMACSHHLGPTAQGTVTLVKGLAALASSRWSRACLRRCVCVCHRPEK